MWVAVASILFVAGLGVFAIVSGGAGGGGDGATAGVWDLGGGLTLCLEPAAPDGGALRGVASRAAPPWRVAVAGSRRDRAVEASLSAGGVAAGTLSATLSEPPVRGLGGVLRLKDPVAGMDLVLRFAAPAPAPLPPAGCGAP